MDLNEFMRHAIDHAHEMFIFFNQNGQVTYANARSLSLLGYDDVDCLPGISELFPTVFQLNDGRLCCGKRTDGAKIETEAYRRNNTCFSVQIEVYQLVADEYSLIGTDITEREQLKKRVRKVDKQIEDALRVKSEFTANVTHELRTPVNGISGNTRELLELETDPEKIRYLNLIERSCANMHSIINNVLDFSKLEAGKFTLEKREFVFRDMIEYAVSNHRNKISEKGLEFLLTIGDEIPERIIGDELRIVQILNNLLSNAVKFTSAGKIVLEIVKTAQVDERIELFFIVIDSGIGIAPEDQDKLFQSFSQVDASISRKFGGTGLGLNITKQLVEMMGGSIHLTSEPGKGSMFSFQIWVEIPNDEVQESADIVVNQTTDHKSLSFEDYGIKDDLSTYGTQENLAELEKKLKKLILCIDMGNWEKAEMFADSVKKMTATAPKEVKMEALHLKMAVQKADHADSIAYHKELMDLINKEVLEKE